MLDAKTRRDALDAAIAELAATPPYVDVVERLVCLRGVSTLTAFALTVELAPRRASPGRPQRPPAPRRFATKDGKGTNDPAKALQVNGLPADNPVRNVWVTETALSTALNASYMAESLSLFGIVVGIALLLSEIGFAILAAGWTLARAETASPLIAKRTPKDVVPVPTA